MGYVWMGENSSPFEKQAANQFAEHIESERDGRATATHDIDDRFWELLGGRGEISDGAAAGSSDRDLVFGEEFQRGPSEPTLFRITDASGEIRVDQVCSGRHIGMDKLDTNDVFM